MKKLRNYWNVSLLLLVKVLLLYVYNTDVNLAIKLIGPMVEMLRKARKNPEATLLLNYLLPASVEGTYLSKLH
jgi:hypothetical protein